MMAPLFKYGYFGHGLMIVLAIAIGIVFGFILEKSGFSSARKLAFQFYLKDFAVLKVMFTAIVVAAVGLIAMAATGHFDMSEMYINPTYLYAQITGGFLLGTGFVLSGL